MGSRNEIHPSHGCGRGYQQPTRRLHSAWPVPQKQVWGNWCSPGLSAVDSPAGLSGVELSSWVSEESSLSSRSWIVHAGSLVSCECRRFRTMTTASPLFSFLILIVGFGTLDGC